MKNINKIKILYVLGSMNNGGTEAFVMNYFRRIDKNNFQCDFLVVGGKKDYYKNEILKYGSNYKHLSYKNNFFIKNVNFVKYIKNNNYDIIHIQSCSIKFLLIYSFLAKIAKAKIIIGHSHSAGEIKNIFIEKYLKNIFKYLISLFIDYGFSCSKSAGNAKFTKKFLESKKFYIIPNAIEIKKFSFSKKNRNLIRKKYNIKNEIVIGTIGRIDKNKNQVFLLNVIAKIKNNKNYKLIIVGDGNEKNNLLLKAKELGISSNLIIVSRATEIEKYYSAFDIFCLPSHTEGFPFVLVEAQANGLKCIISNSVTKETNITSKNIFLPINNPYKWILPILNSKRIDNNIVKQKIKKFDIVYNVLQLEKIYNKITA